MSLSDRDIRDRWRLAGGDFHGPHVEYAFMREDRFLAFMRELMEPAGSPPINLASRSKERAALDLAVKELIEIQRLGGYAFMKRLDDCLARIRILVPDAGER